MAFECIQTQEWIEEEISKPVEQLVEQTEQKCKKLPWWNPLRWLCYLVTTLVTVVVWVVEKVGKWVVRSVCKVIGAIAGFVKEFFLGLWNIVVGIFTLDWRRILDGVLQILLGSLDALFTLGRVFFLLDTLDYIVTEYQHGKLRTYVRTQLSFKYSGQEFLDIVENLRIDHGAFGYRIPMRAVRSFLDSETPSPADQTIPNLVKLHEDKEINLRELCGFEFTEGYWNRKRYKTIKKGPHASGGGGGEIDNPISEDELDTYLSTRGAEGPKFIVLCMRDGVFDTRLRAAERTARQLALMPQWTEETTEVKLSNHINHDGFELSRPGSSAQTNLVNFLVDIIMRKKKVLNPPPPMGDGMLNETDALNDLCTPVVVGVFRYMDSLRGITACLKGSPCGLNPHAASGATFIDLRPDIIWKYVPIHELGHYFGLCHVAGIERIMFSPRGEPGHPLTKWEKFKKGVTWWTIPKIFLTKGEPTFTLEEGMQTWDYIIEHFPARCLGSKQMPSIIL